MIVQRRVFPALNTACMPVTLRSLRKDRVLSMRLTAADNLLLHRFGEEAVLLDLNTETYFTLNSVGVRMWELLTASPSVEQAYESLKAEYDVSAETLRADLDELIEQLRSRQLIKVLP